MSQVKFSVHEKDVYIYAEKTERGLRTYFASKRNGRALVISKKAIARTIENTVLSRGEKNGDVDVAFYIAYWLTSTTHEERTYGQALKKGNNEAAFNSAIQYVLHPSVIRDSTSS